jgi:Xaa-Pro aminopeptidase
MRRMRGAAAIFPSAPLTIRNNDVEHEYRQNSDFYFLTGFEEPNSVAVLVPDHEKTKFVLFVQPRDPERETWTGWRTGEDGAVRDYGADAAFTIDKVNEELPKLIEKADRIYYRFGVDTTFDDRIIRMIGRFRHARQRDGWGPTTITDPGVVLDDLRLIKAGDDLESLRKAVNATCEAHVEAMRFARPGKYEYEIEGVLRYVFLNNGSRRPGYPPIVASGPNATVLHYRDNKRLINERDLVLIDAGAECDYYTADVTRTFPASGRFSEAQAAVYEVVLAAQMEAIASVRPGAKFIEPHESAVRVLTEGMRRLGLLEGELDQLIKNQAFDKFYMHRTSHWLGMDVHDAGSYKDGEEWRRLQPGMVLTIEPGLYIKPDAEGVPERYRGIGVRIEDDVLVTERGCEVVSSGAPKRIDEIEAIMNSVRGA